MSTVYNNIPIHCGLLRIAQKNTPYLVFANAALQNGDIAALSLSPKGDVYGVVFHEENSRLPPALLFGDSFQNSTKRDLFFIDTLSVISPYSINNLHDG